MPAAVDEFWKNQPHLEVLHALAGKVVGQKNRLGYTAEKVLEEMRENEVPEADLVSPRTLRKFLEDLTNNSGRHNVFLSHLLRWVVNAIKRDEPRGLLDSSEFRMAKQYLDELEKSAAAASIAGAAATESREESRLAIEVNTPSVATAPNHAELSLKRLEDALGVVMHFLRLAPAAFESFHGDLFQNVIADKRGRQERHFICYRYHSRPGIIVKSFLSVWLDSSGPAVARFGCFFPDGGVMRRSDGLAVPLRATTYLVGQIQNAGVKTLVVPNLEKKLRSYPGIILSADEDLTPIVARCVLVPTEVSTHHEANAGIFSEKDLESEIKPYREQFTNTIDFILRRPIQILDRKKRRDVEQKEMVAVVEQRLRKDGKPLFTYKGSNEVFNPASTDHYTYNAALTISRDRSREEPRKRSQRRRTR